MIDIHCHLLPNTDDGPHSWEQSLLMCEKAVADGVTHIVATPHCNHRYIYDRQASQAKLDELQNRFPTCGFSLGCELSVSDKNLGQLRADRSQFTIGKTRYVLVEFHEFDLPARTTNRLSEFVSLGLRPVIAHPERIPFLSRKMELLEEWISFGCLTVITAGALTGLWGSTQKRICEGLLKRNLVNAIASDAHDPMRRRPELSHSRKAAARIVGDKRANALVIDNPGAIVRGQTL